MSFWNAPRMTYVSVSQQGHHCFMQLLVTYLVPSHFQCWLVIWTLGIKLQWNLNQNVQIFFEGNLFGNAKLQSFCTCAIALTLLLLVLTLEYSCISSPSAAMVLTKRINRSLFSMRKGFQLILSSQSWENANIYFHVSLTHCGLVTPYGDWDLGQHCLR